jgi:hypothetical protein
MGSSERLALVMTSGPPVCQQQVVHRRVRQQHAQPRVVRRDGVGERGAGAPAQQHHRPGGRGEHRGLGVVDLGERAGGGEVAHHHRERLAAPRLARPQRCDGRLARAQDKRGDSPRAP